MQPNIQCFRSTISIFSSFGPPFRFSSSIKCETFHALRFMCLESIRNVHFLVSSGRRPLCPLSPLSNCPIHSVCAERQCMRLTASECPTLSRYPIQFYIYFTLFVSVPLSAWSVVQLFTLSCVRFTATTYFIVVAAVVVVRAKILRTQVIGNDIYGRMCAHTFTSNYYHYQLRTIALAFGMSVSVKIRNSIRVTKSMDMLSMNGMEILSVVYARSTFDTTALTFYSHSPT